ncbi:thioredoxin-like protein [Apodospora peruviana]|uniref:Thioredoxin-like protein n=1 Tax=Apodospora peruviana TaxID=516989 RepID=A0AAE0IST8_9PEZI|nr:thioredoxin-like protein [Apodospora peruviana]
MFRFNNAREIVTLFHKANSPASVRVATLLKQVSASAAETATEDQASDHSAQTQAQRAEFDLNVTEDAPTTGQLETILDYAGNLGISSIIKGATSKEEALRKFKQSPDNFNRPVVVDWHNGRAIGGGNESAILEMIKALPPKN